MNKHVLEIVPGDGTIAAVKTRIEATIIVGHNTLKDIFTTLDRAQRVG